MLYCRTQQQYLTIGQAIIQITDLYYNVLLLVTITANSQGPV